MVVGCRCPHLIHLLLVLAAFVTSATCCRAEGMAESASMASFWKSQSPIVMPVTSEPGVRQVEFPAVPKKPGCIPVLRFRSYLKTPQSSGWDPYLLLSINGKSLGPDTATGVFRVLNKGRMASTTYGNLPLYRGSVLWTYFGTGSGEVDPRVLSYRDEGYWYLLDISDVVNYVELGFDNRVESNKPNVLSVVNTYKLLTGGETGDCREYVMEDLEVGYLPQAAVRVMRHTELMKAVLLHGPALRAGGAELTVGKSGALQVKSAGEAYYLTTHFSYPGKEHMNFNYFDAHGKPDPKVKVILSRERNSSAIRVHALWPTYRVDRAISTDDARFRIRDTVTNRTNRPIGMTVRYNAVTPDVLPAGSVFLCGSNSLATTNNCAANPTVYIAQQRGSIGIVCEDDLLRVQLDVLKRENSVDFGTHHLGLRPGASCTLEWTIYPSRSTDYWAFINTVRRDWGMNYTVEGPLVFYDDQLKPGRRSVLHLISPWFRYFSGEALTAEQYKSNVQPRIKALVEKYPRAIPMGLIEANLVPFDTTVSGGRLPVGHMFSNPSIADNSMYGHNVTKELTAEFFSKTQWWDSQLKTEDGRAVIDAYYCDPPYCNLLVYPAAGNHQLQYMQWQIDYLMDEVGMKGIYIDQFNLAGVQMESVGRCDFSKWDGHTVDLKQNGEIARAFTDCTLLGASARADLAHRIVSKGGVIVTNGHQVSRRTRGLPIYSFAETDYEVTSYDELTSWTEPPYLPTMCESHLSSPISLGIRPGGRLGQNGRDHFAEVIQKWAIACLKSGSLYYYYDSTVPSSGPGAGGYGIINHMFPFTPVELHSGYLIGKERILTTRSGVFNWQHSTQPRVLVFDLEGHDTNPKFLKMTQTKTGWRVRLQIADWQQTAVIKAGTEDAHQARVMQ